KRGCRCRQAPGTASHLLLVRGLAQQLPRHRMRAGKTAVYRDRLSVDIARLVACEEESDIGELLGLAGTLQRIELPDLVCDALFLRIFEGRLGHTGLGQAWTDRVDADIGARHLLRRSLGEVDDARLRRRIGGGARA